jgi:hypothetical protein
MGFGISCYAWFRRNTLAAGVLLGAHRSRRCHAAARIHRCPYPSDERCGTTFIWKNTPISSSIPSTKLLLPITLPSSTSRCKRIRKWPT